MPRDQRQIAMLVQVVELREPVQRVEHVLHGSWRRHSDAMLCGFLAGRERLCAAKHFPFGGTEERLPPLVVQELLEILACRTDRELDNSLLRAGHGTARVTGGEFERDRVQAGAHVVQSIADRCQHLGRRFPQNSQSQVCEVRAVAGVGPGLGHDLVGTARVEREDPPITVPAPGCGGLSRDLDLTPIS